MFSLNVSQKIDKDVYTDIGAEKMILHLYDLGVEGCRDKDKMKSIQVLSQLIKALNFDFGEIVSSFYELYQYTLHMIEQDNYNQALIVLLELRDVWEKSVVARESVR